MALIGRQMRHRQRGLRSPSSWKRLRDYLSVRENAVRIVACGYLVAIFALGGGSRPDILSLQILRPLSVFALVFAFATLTWQDVARHRFLVVLCSAVVALTASHLIPLPPDIWQGLPGRDIIAANDELVGLNNVWRPLTLDPLLTWNALWSLVVPASLLLLLIQLSSQSQTAIMRTLLVIGALCVLVATIQILTGSRGPLYFYRVTNFGSPTGLFANRNHLAVFLACLLPLLAIWARPSRQVDKSVRGARHDKARNFVALVAAALILPIILLTGSRAGIISFIIGIVAAAYLMLLGNPGVLSTSFGLAKRFRAPAVLGLIALSALAVFAILFGRGAALERLVSSDISNEIRGTLYPEVYKIAQHYAPWGSGIGSFEPIFRMHEPDSFLSPRYANHAHNDLLEVLMTAGWPGAILLAVAIGAFLWASLKALRAVWNNRIRGRDDRLCLVGLTTIFVLAIASLVDYPLRVPSMEALLIVAAVWISSRIRVGERT